MGWRRYEENRDLDDCRRVWREVGWIEPGEQQQDEGIAVFFQTGDVLVAPNEGAVECCVLRQRGMWRHDTVDLPLSIIGAVTTGYAGRQQGYATELTTESLACAHDEGAVVATLGMFEQGFYDRFGFGTGSYVQRFAFDPATLTVAMPKRPTVRLTRDDWHEIAELASRRLRGNGAVTLDDARYMHGELLFSKEPLVALGLRGDDGRLTVALLGRAEGEHGPYDIDQFLYETGKDLLDLFGVLRSLGDQVHLAVLTEPAELQLQDLLSKPISALRRSRQAGGKFRPQVGLAETQHRIMDVPAAIAAHRWVGAPVDFVADITDPLADRGGRWPGVSGTYVVHVGEQSRAERGDDASLPRLSCSVNALTRLWTGARPASSLALTAGLDAPSDLLTALDHAFRLPPPIAGIPY